MHRRSFLKALASTAVLAAGTGLQGPSGWFRPAQAAGGKTLLVIFQRGGCDGLNACVPYGDPDYYRLRPTIAIAPPDAGNRRAALPLDGYFGLHPALAGLADIHAQGDLAILPTVQYAGNTHSHFDAQAFIESGAVSRLPDGWLNRYLSAVQRPGQLRAVAMASRMPQSMRGARYVPVFRDLEDVALNMDASEADALLFSLLRTYGRTNGLVSPYASRLSDSGFDAVDKVRFIRSLDPGGYRPSNGAVYPDTTFGRQLAQVAFLIKAGVGLEAATLNISGWDTHSNQGGGETDGRQYQAFSNLGEGIGAFYRDLGARIGDVMVVTCTEFGRTAAENASKGTDHGGASTWFVVGKNVRGGVHGEWPGLAPGQLDGNRQLRFTVDFRDVLAEILSVHLGSGSLPGVFPGHSYKPVGFLA
ncbi:MAG: DUF1501 domain-containing protein [Pseudomonadota bacterium]|nr:DUF1501 domain-containing protein [Pseudomonadota bacterium]